MLARKGKICCVPNCVEDNADDETNEAVRFIKFPEDRDLQKKWAMQIGLDPSFVPEEHNGVCSKHFAAGKLSGCEPSPNCFVKTKPVLPNCSTRSSLIQHRQFSSAIVENVKASSISIKLAKPGIPQGEGEKRESQLQFDDIELTEAENTSEIKNDGNGTSLSQEGKTHPQEQLQPEPEGRLSEVDISQDGKVLECIAPQCDRNSASPGITMYPFPRNPRTTKKWITLLRLDKFYNVPEDAKICSWHFPEGWGKGPSRFHWNESKSFALNFPLSRKKRVRGKDRANNASSDPDSTAMPGRQFGESDLTERLTKDSSQSFLEGNINDKGQNVPNSSRQPQNLLNVNDSEENESGIQESVEEPSVSEAEENLRQLQYRWAYERKTILDANEKLATQLQRELREKLALEAKLKELHFEGCDPRLLRYENCLENIKYYTGLPSQAYFESLHKLVKATARPLEHWRARPSRSNGSKETPPKKDIRIDNRNQLFFTLCRYKRGFTITDLSLFYGVDSTYLSTVFLTFSTVLISKLGHLLVDSHKIEDERSLHPGAIRHLYPNIFGVLTVVPINLDFIPRTSICKPKRVWRSPVSYKAAILLSTSGIIIHISKLFPPDVSDNGIVIQSGILDLVPDGSVLFSNQELRVDNNPKDIHIMVFSLELGDQACVDKAWETSLLKICNQRITQLVKCLKLYRVFRNGLNLSKDPNAPLLIQTILVLRSFMDTHCLSTDS